jgi:hypothetical protein
MEVNLDKLDENRVEMALMKLAETNELHAALGGQTDYLDKGIKQAEAHAFLLAEGTVAERNAKAIASQQYKDALDAWLQARVQFKKIDNERQHEQRVIDIWRTLSSNRRQGSI